MTDLICNANNITVTNVILSEPDTSSKTADISFTITWENSWRVTTSPSNWDAAWVFLKYQNESTGKWGHLSINTSALANSVEDGDSSYPNPKLDINNDSGTGYGHGMFIYSDGSLDLNGDVSYNVSMTWDYEEDGITSNDELNIRVFAIEMVYVPTASFHLGSGGKETAHFYKYDEGTNTSDTYQVLSENTINIESTKDSLFYDNDGNTDRGDAIVGTTVTVPSNFPKGFSAFYCMKYEVTQGEYVNFINTLTEQQKVNRLEDDYNKPSTRNDISVVDGELHSNVPHVPYGRLQWADLVAYFDWAALRPITELEFEKLCRGTATPVAGEFPWGTNQVSSEVYYSNVIDLINSLDSDSEAIDESIIDTSNTTIGNANYETVSGDEDGNVLRVGAYASYANSNRVSSGATYYGIMNIAGNMRELWITVGNTTGRSFTGLHGNGEIDTDGNADVLNWPGTDAVGTGLRGTSFKENGTLMRTSNRFSASKTFSIRSNYVSGRAGRTAN
ncbi:SUMF1/EgtB/PvdO family nonheme iron enzyme [Flammeovirga kamogawensis]|uniref:SUMF1/EgtB/PvdO family nonheme iron enzyme n=1 Tax=Flammeovirga kamogawensis TaxID=373891 RepID=A0ABX8H1A2_9BACT|nr:SUMF1/EgtB/PvdO family nonheme iron enzyme [Flammeovirga kamogawensis]MBB6462195.1 formylglycine-generating enzyme required for sulfatase activity [Flammeovirga kamogawensis]QWG09404.1 SUMF1/EgtB/PvdO family nonheme iron enzyme [Flammeovirga kamogawensis]